MMCHPAPATPRENAAKKDSLCRTPPMLICSTAFRWPAPTHRHRPELRDGARRPRRRRAGPGARRVDSSSSDQSPHGGAPSPVAHSAVHQPRPRGSGPYLRPCRRDVPRPDRRDRRHACARREPAPPLHGGAVCRRPGPRPDAAPPARDARRRPAEPQRGAGVLRLSWPLPPRPAGLRGGRAAAAPHRACSPFSLHTGRPCPGGAARCRSPGRFPTAACRPPAHVEPVA